MSLILQAHGLKKEFGAKTIFSDLDLELKAGEKAALIGANGAGKTTLFKCLLGLLEAEEGRVKLAAGASIGYVEQIPAFEESTTLWEALASSFEDIFKQRAEISALEKQMASQKGFALKHIMDKYGSLISHYESVEGFACEAKIKKILLGLGFREDEFSRPFKSFSGGEKTKISLGCLLARERQIMLLDEPTNHLDLDALEWLEDFLKSSSSALLIISHDRYFLDNITQTTFHLEKGRLRRYNTSYTGFTRQKAEEDLALERAYQKQQREIGELSDYINKYRAGIKARQARGRQSRLNKIEVLERAGQKKGIALKNHKLHIEQGGEKVLSLDSLSFSFPGSPLFEDLNQEILASQRIALIGPNGAGKTTLIQLILNKILPQKGSVSWGVNIKPGYFAQTHENLNPHNTVLEEIISNYPITLQEARDYLAAFLFCGDEAEKKISSLSGGERARISFLKLYLSKANFLILDEPTNHMDIQSREAFENFLKEYTGTILAISHDRYFIDNIADTVWELNGGQITAYEGNYSRYKQKKAQFAAVPAKKEAKEVNADLKAEKKAANLSQAALRSKKVRLRQDLLNLEEEIERAESRINEINKLLAQESLYQKGGDELKALLEEYNILQKRLPLSYNEWDSLITGLEEYT